MKNSIILLTFAIISTLFASCSSYKHSYRTSEVPDRDISVSDKYLVDVNYDFSKVVKAESGKHASEKAAKEEAYHRAIVDNNIHILVDPIYRVETTPKILIFGGKSIASVVGFAGYYANARPKSVELAKRQKAESELFDQKIKDLEKLSKVTVLGSEEVKTFLIDNNGGGKNGQMHLLHTTVNKESIIDQYNKLNGNYVAPSKQVNTSLGANSVAKSTSSSDIALPKKFWHQTIVQKAIFSYFYIHHISWIVSKKYRANWYYSKAARIEKSMKTNNSARLVAKRLRVLKRAKESKLLGWPLIVPFFNM